MVSAAGWEECESGPLSQGAGIIHEQTREEPSKQVLRDEKLGMLTQATTTIFSIFHVMEATHASGSKA
jgi:hypothetical protein